MSPAKQIFFPPFRLDAELRLYRGGELIPLRAKTLAVLRCLLERPGRLLTKDELLDAVWPETAVTDAVLKVSIRELREALGDDPKRPRFIETAHRSGYRYIAEVKTSNLPAQLTSFVGRERESAEVKRLLAGARLLTLTGAGGSGKTRLAVEVADDLAEERGEEVWWVELASLFDATLVPQAVASALGVRDQPGKTLVQTLCDCLRPRTLTLVVDNCEHLVEACAALAGTLLHACPGLKILATSRETLGVKGEVAFPLPPMSLPDPHRPLSPGELAGFEAVSLFEERARAASPGFALTEGNAGAVCRVCRHLDGLPLAIELAAARVKLLTAGQIAARLDDCFRLLTTSGRTELPRHRTLRAAMDWSYELLDEKERALLRGLSVFAGGWTLEAAEEVCAGAAPDKAEVLDLLSRLVDKSLVVMAERGGEARYRLLEIIRQYGHDKLSESGEAAAVRRRHADYYLRFAETIAPSLNTAERQTWLTRLEVEHDNLRAVLGRAAGGVDASAVLRLCDALFFFWFYRGYWSEGRGWLRDALAHCAAESGAGLRARAMTYDGMLANMTGDHAAARELLEESVSIHRAAGSQLHLAHALNFLAYELADSDAPRARSLAEEGVRICRRVGDKFFTAMSLIHLGAVAFTQGDYGAARNCYEEAVGLCRELGDKWALAAALRGLGGVASRQGDYDLAAARLKEGLAALRELKERWLISRTLDTLAEMYSARRSYGQAARLFGASAAAREAVGASVFPFYRDEHERRIAAARLGLGEEAFDALWAEGRAMGSEQAVAYALSETDSC